VSSRISGGGGSREVVRTSLTCVLACSDRPRRMCTHLCPPLIGAALPSILNLHCHDCHVMTDVTINAMEFPGELPSVLDTWHSLWLRR
jgi:hypothetical protein